MAREVKISAFFGKHNPDSNSMRTLRDILMHMNCQECGDYILWDDGYVMDDLIFEGETKGWCSGECLQDYKDKEDDY